MARAFRIDLSGAQESTPNASTATGIGIAIFDDSLPGSPKLQYTINVIGLDWGGQTPGIGGDNVLDGHFHQAAAGVDGPVRFDWDTHDLDDYSVTGKTAAGVAPPRARIDGVWENADGGGSGNANDLSNFVASFTTPAFPGAPTDIYANIHSAAIPGGEIRGQLVLLSTDIGDFIVGREGNHSEILPGLGGDDMISGLDGDDTINGGAGNDTLIGGNGNDVYYADPGEIVVEDPGQGTIDMVHVSSGSFTIPVNVEVLKGSAGANTLIGNGDPNAIGGNEGADTLFGLGGADSLYGGLGDDTLSGGDGADRLFGDAGADRFAYGAVSEAGDLIVDFEGGADKLQFNGAAFGFAAGHALTASEFIANTNPAPPTSGPTFLLETDTRQLRFDADGSNAGAAVLIATIYGNLPGAGDLVFV